MPISYGVNVSWVERRVGGVTHRLFEEAVDDGGIHHFVLIHLTDFGANDILCETLHYVDL